MQLQNIQLGPKDGLVIRALSSVLLLTATALLVGSLIKAHPVIPSPNSGQMTIDKTI